MEREGRREGRGGGEKMKGILIGGMVIGLLLGCNNGLAELEKEKDTILSISNLRQGFLDVFATFGGMVSDVLGIKAGTTKQKVGEHFGGLSKKIQLVLERLTQITTKEGDSKETQGDILSGAVKKANDALTKLKENLDLLAKIGGDEEKQVGEVDSNKQGVASDVAELKNAHKVLKGIVNAAASVGVEAPKESSVQMNATVIGVTSNPEYGAKVLTASNHAGSSAVGDKASLIVSAVRGEEMLAAIVKSNETDADSGVGSNASATTSVLAFAKGDTETNVAKPNIKPGAVSAGIALRSLVKSGKLAAQNSSNNDEKAVQLVGADAANKLVGAVETLIIKTVNKALEGVKQAITTSKSN